MQHPQVRRDLEEQCKQKEVCKALAGTKGAAAQKQHEEDGSDNSSVGASDITGLRKMEQLVQQLLPPPTNVITASEVEAAAVKDVAAAEAGADKSQQGDGGVNSQEQDADSNQTQERQCTNNQTQQQSDEQQDKDQQQQGQKSGGSHGPKLPQPPKKANKAKPAGDDAQPTAKAAEGNASNATASSASQSQMDAANELDKLVQASSACCIYFRVCGGLKAATTLLTGHASQQGKQAQSNAETAAQQKQRQRDTKQRQPEGEEQKLIGAVLGLLYHIIDNDANLLKLAEEPSFVGAALSLLHG